MNKRAVNAPALIAVTALFAVTLVAILIRTGGVFVYSLDDPYIHLAMADQIRVGGYGVNAGEAASAASSFIYPYLLVIALALGAGLFAPLLLNYLAAMAMTAIMVTIGHDAGLFARPLAKWLIALLAIVWAAIVNVVGIGFMGMEHLLQAMMALLAVLGLVRFLRSDRLPVWLPLVLGLQVAVRFEGAGVLVAGVLVLAVRGRWLAGLLAIVIAAAALGLFMYHLHSLGLPWLPSSVLVKASMYNSGALDGVGRFLQRLLLNLLDPMGLALAAIACVLLWRGFGRRGARLWPLRDWPAERFIALFACVCIGGHLVVAATEWPHRYENYLVVIAVAAGLAMEAPAIAAVLARGRAAMRRIGLGLILVLAVFNRDVVASLLTPTMSREIYLQQYQMRRFAQEFVKGPVAVNDLGLVVWRNPDYVLDLWGLASNEARIAGMARSGPDWMDRLARRHGVSLVMIFDPWFRAVPQNWRRVGKLAVCAKAVTAAHNTVTFYATSDQELRRLSDLATQWRKDLPSPAFFVLEGETPPPCL